VTPLALIASHPWRQIVFTTYSLSLSFFEAVVLEAMIRGNARDATIFPDLDGIRLALREQGIRGVGRTYQVEPIKVTSGIFHPKMIILFGSNECHLVIGSGNLTFGGWGANLEVIEHLHPSFAGEAFRDAAVMFDGLGDAANLRHGAREQFLTAADQLRIAAGAQVSSPKFRLLHSFAGPIFQQIKVLVDDLGGAQRLCIASPFFDSGAAVDRLASDLNVDEVHIHVHRSQTVLAEQGANWPRRAVHAIRPVQAGFITDQRPLHAKFYEIVCRRGRILISGSANATVPALGSAGNVEAVVARIQRARVAPWKLVKTEGPLIVGSDENEPNDPDSEVGVVRASLSGSTISGHVLSPNMSGAANLIIITAHAETLIGEIALDANQHFTAQATGVRKRIWTADRLLIAVESTSGARAEGFLSLIDYQHIVRRSGALADRLFAVIGGRETPADVAAILAWFSEDPRRLRLATPDTVGSGGIGTPDEQPPMLVAFAEIEAGRVIAGSPDVTRGPPAETKWGNFIEQFFSALREMHGAIKESMDDDDDEDDNGEDDEDEDGGRALPRRSAIRATAEVSGAAFATFEQLLDLLLSPNRDSSYPIIAFDLAQYICDRLEADPIRARDWLRRILNAILSSEIPQDRLEDITAAVVLFHATSGTEGAPRRARTRLLALGVDVLANAPRTCGNTGFIQSLGASEDISEFWRSISSARSMREQIDAYLSALTSGRPSDGYPDLPKVTTAWRTLEAAITNASLRRNIYVVKQSSPSCPRHHMTLPTGERSNLQQYGVGIARNCCQSILICDDL
jgi:hypothetical protein